MASKEEMLTEAYNRGILPADKKAAYEEAQRRGLIAAQPQTQQQPDYGYGQRSDGTPLSDAPHPLPDSNQNNQPGCVSNLTHQAGLTARYLA